MADRIDPAGRAIAGLLGYNPGPGIYSRLERAVQALPANVRAEELPGLLKRYKDGIPGWELKETDLPGLIGDAKVIQRQDLLDRVRERSPVFTHREIVLGGSPQASPLAFPSQQAFGPTENLHRQEMPSRLGEGVSHGQPKYEDYSQGGEDYAELLLVQPRSGGDYGNHWKLGRMAGSPEVELAADRGAVAHARYDTHGDALRINELQSDLGIHNRKAREVQQQLASQIAMPDDYALAGTELPFPLEDAWSDILIKRLALEAARKGHRAIEIASPRAIADKVGGNVENYEHFYGKVVPGAIERLGRRLGGMIDDTDAPLEAAARRARGDVNDDLNESIDRLAALADLPDIPGTKLSGQRQAAERLLGDLGRNAYRLNSGDYPSNYPAKEIHKNIADHLSAVVGHGRMNEMFLRANEIAAAEAARKHAVFAVTDTPMPTNMNPAGRRYLMSDEMRKRILTQGIGASVLAPMLMEDE